jgi:hypothetical protein
MDGYDKHFRSAAWRRVREREIEAAGYRCRLCARESTPDNPLEGHHRTYENFGCERDGDVTALCRECHVVVTNMIRGRRYASQPATFFDIVLSVAESMPLFDPTDKEFRP